MYYKREEVNGVDPIWEYCKQEFEQRRRNRVTRFLVWMSCLGFAALVGWVASKGGL